MLIKKLGRIAEVRDMVEAYGFVFEVLSIDGPRILKVKIKKTEETETPDVQESDSQ